MGITIFHFDSCNQTLMVLSDYSLPLDYLLFKGVKATALKCKSYQGMHRENLPMALITCRSRLLSLLHLLLPDLQPSPSMSPPATLAQVSVRLLELLPWQGPPFPSLSLVTSYFRAKLSGHLSPRLGEAPFDCVLIAFFFLCIYTPITLKKIN